MMAPAAKTSAPPSTTCSVARRKGVSMNLFWIQAIGVLLLFVFAMKAGRLSDRHGMTQLALTDQPLEELIDRAFLRLLTRHPSNVEMQLYRDLLSEGYETRVIPESKRVYPEPTKREPARYVSWSNHVDGPANSLAIQREAEARRGDPPTNALHDDWRLRMEDFLWAVLNAPEWIYTP